jgi:DNA-binding CsgD family transcriptional regulator
MSKKFKIAAMLDAGFSYREIAKEQSCSEHYVRAVKSRRAAKTPDEYRARMSSRSHVTEAANAAAHEARRRARLRGASVDLAGKIARRAYAATRDRLRSDAIVS